MIELILYFGSFVLGVLIGFEIGLVTGYLLK